MKSEDRLAGLMLAFPTYAHVFVPKTENKTIVTDHQKSRQQNLKYTE